MGGKFGGHLVGSGDIFGCYNSLGDRGGWYYWNLVGKVQGGHETFYKAQNIQPHPQQRII